MTSAEAELAKTFDAEVVERYARHFIELLIASIKIPEGKIRALDLACGTGYGTIPLRDALPEGSIIVALNDERFALKEFHKLLTHEMRQQIFPRKESLARLPFADATYDLVYACLPTRLWEPPGPVIREALRVLRPGGTLALSVPLRGSFIELLGAMAAGSAAEDSLAVQRALGENTRLANADEWVKLASHREPTGGAGASIALEPQVKRSSFKLSVEPPAAKDRLVSRHLAPLWLGESPSADLDAKLDAALGEAVTTTVHIGCILAQLPAKS